MNLTVMFAPAPTKSPAAELTPPRACEAFASPRRNPELEEESTAATASKSTNARRVAADGISHLLQGGRRRGPVGRLAPAPPAAPCIPARVLASRFI